MRVVLANGVFDLLHVAHVRHLEEAKSLGDFLAVGLTMDSNVGKPGRPIINQHERMEMLKALRCVDRVILCSDSLDALEVVRPNVFCKGHDYVEKGLLDEERAFCATNGIEIVHTQHNPQSTTKIIEKIWRG